MIRSTRHHIRDLNGEKASRYQSFLKDYSDYTIAVVNYIWRKGYREFSVKENQLSLPKFIDYNAIPIRSDLSARAKSSAVEQASSIIRSSVEKQRRRLWVRENKNPNVKDVAFSKPKIKFVKPNLGTKCCDFKLSNGKFYGFVHLKSLGKKYGRITIPIVHNPRMGGVLRNGFIFGKDRVQLCWDKPTNPTERGEKILGIDQGFSCVASLSDGQTTPSQCPHGHSLNSIIDKVSRKKKGSKSFQKAVDHRQNFVNWSINQLNFSGVKEVRLEKIVNIRYKKRTSRKMSHWSNPEIRDKIKSRCEELEVPVIEQSCAYRSQRCNQCGQVRKANRKGKTYCCKNCGYSGDADTNASINHSLDLPSVPWAFFGQKLNLGNGFFWKPEGFLTFDGAELRVPHCQN